MKIDCAVICDLLPLYADDACSQGSRDMVEEHLRACPACSAVLKQLRETKLESTLRGEKNAVIEYGVRRFRRRSAAVGSAVSGLLMIPILACLIINLVSAPVQGWYYVVLAAMCVAASLIAVPLLVSEDKLFWTFCAFCASLTVLLGVTCLYTRGDWFWIASSASLFGLSAVFLPFVVRARPVRRLIGDENRLLVVLGVDIALFANMIYMISARGRVTGNSILFALALIAGILLVLRGILRKR